VGREGGTVGTSSDGATRQIHWPNPTPGSGVVVGLGRGSIRDHVERITSRNAV
jgi:hypothetical protein